MHGAGNDFVVVPEAPPPPERAAELVRRLADRRLGIGADGVLFLERLDHDPTLRMHFYNCDGGRAGLCLNGARCVALRAKQLGWSGPAVRIRTDFSAIEAEVASEGRCSEVRLVVDLPGAAAESIELPSGATARRGWAVHTGDPHLVVESSGVAEMDLEAEARPLRWWTGPDPDGSNVHFVERLADRWLIRSFERGIEGETLACGSGCVSAWLALRSDAGSKIELQTRTGARIRVGATDGRLELSGPAELVFETDWMGDG
jgi:diaminopimelate epimerase